MIILFVVLTFTLFKLKSIKFEFHNQTTLYAEDTMQAQMIKDAKFPSFASVLFLKKSEPKNILEKLNPYLKIHNIETVFPDSLVIHASEREETFSVLGLNSTYFICDTDFKVLRKQTNQSYVSMQDNPILLTGVIPINFDAEEGDFLRFEKNLALIKSISPSLLLNNRNVSQQKAIYSKIEVAVLASQNYVLKLYNFDNFLTIIEKPLNNLASKLQIAFACYPQIPVEKIKTHHLEIFETNSGVIDNRLTENKI
ncbi:MAG: hypothetical protein RR140_02780 [Clostridia bacterium]